MRNGFRRGPACSTPRSPRSADRGWRERLPTSFDDPRQQVVHELASALVAARIVPLGLYRRARELPGDAGIVDVAVLLGWFTMVCMRLNSFDVPANAEGFDQ